jgi:cytochrome c5
MKTKIISAVIIGLLISCGSKSGVSSRTEANSKNKDVVVASDKTSKNVVMTKELAEGKETYENNCAKCHKLFDPTEYTKENWAPILVSMQKKAKLEDAQMASISNYIYSQL